MYQKNVKKMVFSTRIEPENISWLKDHGINHYAIYRVVTADRDGFLLS